MTGVIVFIVFSINHSDTHHGGFWFVVCSVFAPVQFVEGSNGLFWGGIVGKIGVSMSFFNEHNSKIWMECPILKIMRTVSFVFSLLCLLINVLLKFIVHFNHN